MQPAVGNRPLPTPPASPLCETTPEELLELLLVDLAGIDRPQQALLSHLHLSRERLHQLPPQQPAFLGLQGAAALQVLPLAFFSSAPSLLTLPFSFRGRAKQEDVGVPLPSRSPLASRGMESHTRRSPTRRWSWRLRWSKRPGRNRRLRRPFCQRPPAWRTTWKILGTTP